MSGSTTSRTIPVSELNPELQRVYADQDMIHDLRQQQLANSQSQGNNPQTVAGQVIAGVTQFATSVSQAIVTATQSSRDSSVALRLIEQNRQTGAAIYGTGRGAPNTVRDV